MRTWMMICVLTLSAGLSGCAALCGPGCNAGRQSSSTLMQFLYPGRQTPAPTDAIPELHLPLRIGLAFLPSEGRSDTLDASHKEQLLGKIRDRFSSRRFVAEIVVIPDYYLAGRPGIAGLEAVQRLYGLDLMALVSYDQVLHEDENNWSLGYLTVVGAYLLKGSRHDVSTLVDLAVVDPVTRSLVLRAGGTDTRHGTATFIQESREAREAGVDGFTAATTQMIEHFDLALSRFETDVRAGKANVHVVNKDHSSGPAGGAGAFSWTWLLALLPLVALRARGELFSRARPSRVTIGSVS